MRGFGERDRSLRQIFSAIRDDVARMEREKTTRHPSRRCRWAPKVADLYDAPLF